jgi:hypothetical protein
MSRSIERKLSGVLIVLCTFAVASPPVARAGIGPTPFRSGLFGVTPEQSIRISVVNAGEALGTIAAYVRILDLAGTVLAERRGRTLSEGIGTFVDVALGGGSSTGTALPGATRPTRAQVRAEVFIEYLPVAADGQIVPDDEAAVLALQRNVRLTLEVFEVATGRTSFTMPFVAKGFDPQPDPPAN